MVSYYQGETVIISAEIKDASGNLTDPSTITCTIFDPAGSIDASGNMTQDSSGNYHYDDNLAEDAITGIWLAEIDAVIGTRTVTEKIQFVVGD